ncbi:MAG: flagellar hook capping FlgD N-terminal domain-containing protein, partial [Terracidiphilus sp.]
MNIQGINPLISAPVLGQSASATTAASKTSASSNASSTSSSDSSSTSASNLEGTFLNLLVTELQNQDPTSPVDPTQMVSQMVS